MSILRIGEFDLDPHSGELRRNGSTVRLPEQPLRILLLLLERRDQLVSRDDLRERLWPADTFVDFDMGLNRAVRKLRDLLGDSADSPRYIETVPKRGYRLIADVAEPETAEPAVRRRPVKWIAIATIAVALVAAIIAAIRFYDLRRQTIHSIAVLPLANLSSDRSQDYFADGMTEALITDLAQLRNVTVISRTSVMAYKGSKKSLPQIARELHVEGIVEGSVVRAGGRVRITAQLIHAPTDRHLWARSYERSETDVITLERELAESITDALRAELTSEARTRMQTAAPIDPEAYDLFLKGMTAAGRQNTQGFTEAIAYYSKAVAKQPDFALAYIEIAESYRQFTYSGAVAPHEFMPKAKAAALKALALDPALASAHVALGNIIYQYDWDWSRSEKEFRRALDLDANNVGAHRGLGTLLTRTGRAAEARAEMARVHELDPRHPGGSDAALGAGFRLRNEKNYDQAIAQMRKALELDPSVARAHFQLGLTLVEAGKLDEGITELENAVRLAQNNVRFQASVGWAYALAGRTEEARAVLQKLETRARNQYVSPVSLASIHVALHENDRALQWLEQAYVQRDFELIMANKSGRFESLRNEPRFRELMRKIGLPEA